MHELAVTESILQVVLDHARQHGVKQVLSVTLRIGELSELEAVWLQKYFDFLSKDTLAQGAKLKIEIAPIVVQCADCGYRFVVKARELEQAVCPACELKTGLIFLSGKEYLIKEMEAR